MNDWLALFWVLLVGAGIGIFYFGGLWLTVNQLTKTGYPDLLFLVSFLVRTAVTLVGFYLVMGSRWERAAGLVIGFLLARSIMVRYRGIVPQER